LSIAEASDNVAKSAPVVPTVIFAFKVGQPEVVVVPVATELVKFFEPVPVVRASDVAPVALPNVMKDFEFSFSLGVSPSSTSVLEIA
jgi:hypothetical protein